MAGTRRGFGEQLPFDFSVSAGQRVRKEKLRQTEQPLLFASIPADIDVHLHTPATAVATLGGDVESSRRWLESIVGPTETIKGRRVAFPVKLLDRLLSVRPPAKVTLDAAAGAVARALWATSLGYAPLRVTKQAQRIIASSPRWPAGMNVKDAPWTAVSSCVHLGLPLDIDKRAAAGLADRLGKAGQSIAHAGLTGSSVHLIAHQPQLLEQLKLPALAYSGAASAGEYRMPLLAAEALLYEPTIELTDELRAAIKRSTGRPKPLANPDGFPWTLYPFQAADAGRGLRSLESAGGVLLAGDMGSGKTTISLALVSKLDVWPLLVVSPLAAFSTWARQLNEMGRSFYLASEAPKIAWQTIESGEHDAVIISYDRLHAFVELVEQMGFAGIVADELQRISSPGSRRSRALRQIASAFPIRIGLSGTPMSNTLADLLPLGAFLVPGEWKPRANAKDLADLYPGDPVEAVAEHLGTLMVRRRMDEVGVQLPDKVQRRVLVQLTPEQRRALEDLQREATEEVEEGGATRMHVFAKLQKMRQIIGCPSAAGVAGPNPKVRTAVELALEFNAADRKCVLFCANRQTWRDLGAACEEAGLPWVGIWGSSSVAERLEAERRFHADDNIRVFVGTLQSCAESLTLSPTGTVWISCDYLYNPSQLAQAEARVYRLNSDADGPPIEIIYLHAQVPGGGLDDRMVEILELKRSLISQVVDRRAHVDATKVHYSLGDLVFLLTGTRDDKIDMREADGTATMELEQSRKDMAKATAHKRKYRNDATVVRDDGTATITLEEYAAIDAVDELLDDEAVEVDDALADDDDFDTADDFEDELDDGHDADIGE